MATRCEQLERQEREVMAKEQQQQEVGPHGPLKERDVLEFVHEHEFWHVVGYFFNKLPDPDYPDCHSVEIVSSNYDRETKRLTQTRIFEVINPCPYILRVLFKKPYWRFEETSVVDFKNLSVDIRSINLDFKSLVDCVERSFFTMHTEDPKKTHFRQTAALALNSMACLGMNNTIEKLALKHVRKAGTLAVELFEKKLANLTETPELKLPEGVDISELRSSYREATEAHL